VIDKRDEGGILRQRDKEKKVRSPKIKYYKCKFCGNNKGMVRKYGIMLCRRCFKDNAEAIGFRKYS
jgi:ribosomal protein S14